MNSLRAILRSKFSQNLAGLLILLLTGMSWSAPSRAACASSTFTDGARFNEYYFGTDRGHFLEVFIENINNIPQTDWQNWYLRVYTDASTFTDYTLNDSTANYCEFGAKGYITYDVPSGLPSPDFTTVLFDASGNEIDYLDACGPPGSCTLPGYYTPESPACNTTDNDINIGSLGNKDIARFPDGTGDWNVSSETGANTTYSFCSSNNTGISKVASTAAPVIGSDFTYTIDLTNGSNKDQVITVVDVLPTAGVTYSSVTVTQGTTSYSAPDLTWSVGTLVKGTAATMTITVTASTLGEYTNNVSVTSCTGNTCPSTNPSDAATVTIVAPAVDHYEVSLSTSSGVTCDTVEVTITSVNDSHAAVAPGNGTILTLTGNNGTDDRGAWVSVVSGSGTLTDSDLTDGVATYQFTNDSESAVTLEFAYTNPIADPDSITFSVSDGTYTHLTGTGSADTQPTLSMASAGFIFYNSTDSNKTIPTQIAGKPSDTDLDGKTLQLRAVKASDDSLQCAALFTGATDVAVELGAECKDPNTCAATSVNITNTTIGSGSVTTTIATGNDNADDGGADDAPAYTSVTLGFNANSIADIVLQYDDVGQIQLHSRYDQGNPANSYIDGNTSYTIRPFALYVDDIKRTSDSVANPAATDATGTIFVKAGDGATSESQFSARISAVLWQAADDDGSTGGTADDGIPDTGSDLSDNGLTTNFGNENTVESVTLTHTLVDPSPGTTGTLANGLYNGFASTGTETVTNLAWDEVGIISLTAAITDGSYLGIGSLPSYAAQSTVGRFYPDHFNVTDNTPNFADSCTSFTYMGQAFYYNTAPALDIEARSTTASITNNYDRGYNKAFTLGRSAVHGGAAVNATFSTSSGGTIATSGTGGGDGTITLTLTSGSTGDSFLYDRVTALQGLFNADVDLTFSSGGLTDTDGVYYDSANANNPDAYTITAMGSTEQRFGRFVLDNAYGSELINLPVSFRTEYYYDDGTDTSFAINTADACTAFTLADHLRLSNAQTAAGALQKGDTAMTIDSGSSSITNFNIPLSGGDAGVVFSAPGSGNIGDIKVDGNIDCSDGTIACVTTDTFSYLLYDWDNDDNHDNNPEANITFGIYNRSKRIIYSREPW